MSLATIAAGCVAGAAYLEGKYQIWRDISIVLRLKKAEYLYNQKVKADRLSPWYLFERACMMRRNERAIWSRTGVYTFGEMYNQAVRVAQWLLEQGIRPGDLVGMYLVNSPEFLIFFLATHCIGAAPALINYNLEGKSLLHCLDVCDSKVLIIDEDDGCQARISESRRVIEGAGTKIFTLNDALKRKFSAYQVTVPGDEWRKGVTGNFPFCLLYTSGTTGLPKGCPFTTSRMHLLGSHDWPPFGLKPGVDCWYSPMPMYHGTAVMACTTALLGGIGVAVAPRFSVSGFWPDVHESGSTVFIYVGEAARYLINAPYHPLERDHKLRLAYGNGLRPDVWSKLQERFGIPEIAEFFSSSEGVLGFVVWDRGEYLQDCVGHHGLLFRLLSQNILIPVMVDHETGDIWRDPQTGFAKRMPYEEGGEILVAVPDREAFGGYWKNQKATDKRFAVNVFKEGDLFYRSGDALRRSPDGHWYFLDRLGDTFRWKSENVSTAEVAEVLGRFPGIIEANVYGVTVPYHEGRAGCAALQLDSGVSPTTLDYDSMLRFVRKQLPKYAVPVFLRISKANSHIHNYKQNKVLLRKEGVDPELLGSNDQQGKEDTVMWLSPKHDKYMTFTNDHWQSIMGRQLKL